MKTEKIENKPKITFVSDDFSNADSKYSQKKDPISSMFDIYLSKPKIDTVGFNPFSQSNFQPVQMPDYWRLPNIDWNKISDLNSCVVLYRTHSQSRSIEEVFLKNKACLIFCLIVFCFLAIFV